MSGHSKLPWRACNEGKCKCGQIWSQTDDHPVAEVISGKWGDTYPALKLEGNEPQQSVKPETRMIEYGEVSPETAQANAQLIVRAVNSHAELVAALQAIVALDDGDQPDLWHFEAEFEAARAAIARATGEGL